MKIDGNKFIVIFECCRIVRGYTRSVFCDLQRKKNRFIPNDLADLLLAYNKRTIYEIFSYYPTKDHHVIVENISVLIDDEFIFLTDRPERFPSMSLDWDEPNKISNVVLEHGYWSQGEVLKNVFTELNSLGCQHLEYRVYKSILFSEWITLIREISKEKFSSLVVFSNLPFDYELSEIIDLVDGFDHIRIFLFSADEYIDLRVDLSSVQNVFYVNRDLSNRYHCGNFGLSTFVVNVKMFTESTHFNSCLNRKISIDNEGNIGNCPSMSETYGRILDTTLSEALNKPGFKKYWNIKKDLISVCKDCEFRYMCHDCRAYLEDTKDNSGPDGTNLSKPLKCGYDPYTGKWAEWSTNPLKQKAIEFYGMEELIADRTKAQDI